MEREKEANQLIHKIEQESTADCVETRKLRSVKSLEEKGEEDYPPLSPGHPPLPELLPEPPEIILNYAENRHPFPIPDTYAIDLCCIARKFFFTYAFEELPYWETEFKSAQDLETAKKFLKQIRETGGYDVDCIPPHPLKSLWYPVNLEQCRIDKPREFEHKYIRPVLFAIKEINEEEGLSLEFVELVKAVDTMFFLKYFTFTVRRHAIETMQALVGDPPSSDIELVEWKGLNGKPLLQVSPEDCYEDGYEPSLI